MSWPLPRFLILQNSLPKQQRGGPRRGRGVFRRASAAVWLLQGVLPKIPGPLLEDPYLSWSFGSFSVWLSERLQGTARKQAAPFNCSPKLLFPMERWRASVDFEQNWLVPVSEMAVCLMHVSKQHYSNPSLKRVLVKVFICEACVLRRLSAQSSGIPPGLEVGARTMSRKSSVGHYGYPVRRLNIEQRKHH